MIYLLDDFNEVSNAQCLEGFKECCRGRESTMAAFTSEF